MTNPVVADRRQEFGRRQGGVVGLPDGPDRTSRVGKVVVRVVGYLVADFPRISVRWAVLGPHSSRGLW